jgi:hypothetical protein
MALKCKKHNISLIVKKFFPSTEQARYGSVEVYCPECEEENKSD